MGDIADIMLDGTLCASCGEELGYGTGYPQFCAACDPGIMELPYRDTQHQCLKCGKKLQTKAGLDDHVAAVHTRKRK